MVNLWLTGIIYVLFSCGMVTNANVVPASSYSVLITETSTDWNKILDEYEEYVNQYIKTYKKALDGDFSAMTEYVKLLEKAQKLSEKIEKAKGEMSNAQLQRYLKITQKMADALK